MKNKLRGFTVVLRKEFVDFFRDKKTIFALLLPALIYPIMFAIIGVSIGGLVSQMETANIALIDLDNKAISIDDERYQTVSSLIDGTSLSIDSNSYDDYYSAIKNGDIDLAVVLPNSLSLEDEKQFYVIYDSSSTMGFASASVIDGIMNNYYYKLVEEKLNVNIEEEKNMTLQAVEMNVYFNKKESGGNGSLAMILPFLATILLVSGGMNVAIDLIAGEKERNTFEPLLTTSASRLGILSAKYVVVITFSFIAAIVQILGMVLSIFVAPDFFAMSSSAYGAEGSIGSSLALSGGSIALLFVNFLLLAAIFSSLLLILSSTAKSFKEASAKCSILIVLPAILNLATLFQDASKVTAGTMAIPIINVTTMMKMIFSNRIDYGYFAISIGVNLALVAIAIALTLFTFNREKLITRA